MNPSPTQERPDVAVANHIVARLTDQHVLPPAFAQRVTTQLADGSFSAAEWRRLAEQVLAWETKEGDHAA